MPTYYVDTAGSGTSPYDTWAKAINTAALFEAFLEQANDPAADVAAGDIIYVQGGITLTAADAWATADGTATAPITIIGVTTGTTNEPPTYADWADANLDGGADTRPTIAMGANACVFGSRYKVFNIKFTTAAAEGIRNGSYSVYFNCKSVQSSTTANRVAFMYGAIGGSFIHCEACGNVGTSAECVGIGFGTTGWQVGFSALFCYAHDLNTGYSMVQSSSTLCAFSIAENCAVAGFDASSRYNMNILNCSFNKNVRAIIGTTADGMKVVNNLIEGSTTDGVRWTTQTDGNFFWHNHGDDARNNDMWDGVAETGVHSDLENTAGDPKITADGNLSLQADSPCIDAADAAVLGVS